jgi:hypothetical protein
MAPRSVRFGVRSWKLSNIGQSLDECYLELLRASSHVKPLDPAALAVVITLQPALSPRGYSPFSLCVIQKGRPVPQQWGH